MECSAVDARKFAGLVGFASGLVHSDGVLGRTDLELPTPSY